MKTVRTLAVLAAAAVLLLASGAPAQAAAPYLPSYFSLMGGAYVPEGTDLDADNADTGLTGLLVFGYQVNPFFGVQTDLGYFETSGDRNLQVSAIPVVVSFKFGFPIAFIEPYVLGGGGVYFASTETSYLNDNTVEFGAHAAGGLNLNFGKFQIGAEARYLWLEANGLDVDGVMVMGKIGARF